MNKGLKGGTVLGGLVAASMVLAACAGTPSPGGSGGSQETITLKYAASFGETTHEEQLTIDWFLDQVEERTDGRVEFERFYDGSLVAVTDLRDALQDGRIDLVVLSAVQYPTQFPMWNVAYFPLPGSNNRTHSMAQHELLETNQALATEIKNNGLHTSPCSRRLSLSVLPPPSRSSPSKT